MLQFELQGEHLDVWGLPWAVVLQLDHLDIGKGWCVKEIDLAQGWGGKDCEHCTSAAL